MIPLARLGSSGPDISVIGLGAWAMGGPGWFASWGPQDDEVSVATVHRALDEGYTWIDTAAIYGLGHSEEVVGRAVRDRREGVVIATKCTNRWDADRRPVRSGRPESIREECDESLRRLGIEHIDLYQVHAPVSDTPLVETWGELCRLQDAGKVRSIGLSNVTAQQVRECDAVRHVDSVQPSYNLLNRGVEAELMPTCLDLGIGVIPYGAMAEGLLSGSFDPARLQGDDLRKEDRFVQLMGRARPAVEALRALAAELGWTVGQVAIAWALAHPAVTSVIVGARRPEQASANAVPGRATDLADLRARVDAALAEGAEVATT